MDQTFIKDTLNASSLFCRHTAISAVCRVACHSEGSIVRDEYCGEPSVGLLACGRIYVYASAPDGKEVLLNTLRRGECFGISNLAAGPEMGTLLYCCTDARVVYIPKKTVLEMLKVDGEFAVRYVCLCCEKLQFLLGRIEMLSIQSCRGKLAAYLMSNQNTQGRVWLDGSREELAKSLDVSRAALFRALSHLQIRGALRVNGSFIEIMDEQALQKNIPGA